MGKWRKPAKFTVIQPTWRGIFVTCIRGRETQCAREVRDWFEPVAEEHWPAVEEAGNDSEGEDDVEADIRKELEGMKTKRKSLVVHDKLGVECVIFVQTRQPVDPVGLCLKVCEQAFSKQRTAKYIQRLAPVTQFVKCDAELSELSGLEPVFQKMQKNSTFAIRPTLRLCAATREVVIPQIAKLVGPDHKVDLKQFEQLVLVEGFKGVIGASVLDLPAAEFERLCRLNIKQIVAS